MGRGSHPAVCDRCGAEVELGDDQAVSDDRRAVVRCDDSGRVEMWCARCHHDDRALAAARLIAV